MVDDGSLDSSVEVVKSYAQSIKLIEQKNQGVSAVRNSGFRAASGDYIIFLDSDDWLSEDIVEAHVQTVIKWPEVDICCADAVNVNRQQQLSKVSRTSWPDTPGTPLALFLLVPPPFPACEIYKATTVSKLGGHDKDMKAFADASLRLRIIIHGGKVVRTEGGHGVYRKVENSITKNSLRMHFFACKLILKLSMEKTKNQTELNVPPKERLIRHRPRLWFNMPTYHLSFNHNSVIKFIRHFFKISKVDPDYIFLFFVITPGKETSQSCSEPIGKPE